jgi:hypothetical protein
MDRIANYRALIIKAITESYYYRFPLPYPHLDRIFLRDETNDYYMLYEVGWKGNKPVENTILLVRIKEGKIWIDVDWTEDGIVTDLLRFGVPPSDIVQAWVHPDLRETPEPLLVG